MNFLSEIEMGMGILKNRYGRLYLKDKLKIDIQFYFNASLMDLE